MLRHIITPLLFCCLNLPAMAEDVQLQANHPESYEVVRGDTLWGISGKFLKDPWLWPKVWQMNREEIKNPHLIYPGDEVMLDYVNGRPRLRLNKGHRTVTLNPGIREEALDRDAVPTISPNVIEPFLSKPLIIEKDELKQAVSIVGGQENRVILGSGVKVYADKIEENAGLFWQVYREGKPLIDPFTKETLGIEAIYLGDAKVTRYGEPATIDILRAKEEIFIGDKLLTTPESTSTNFVPRAPDGLFDGRVMSIYGGIAEAGNNAIVTINLGKTDGMEPGHVLAIYREGKLIKKSAEKIKELEQKQRESKQKEVAEHKPDGLFDRSTPKPERKISADSAETMIKLPDERVGLLMIFRTFDRVSYALVMQADEPINVKDLVHTP